MPVYIIPKGDPMFRKSKISRSMMSAAEQRKLPLFATPAAITRRIRKVHKSIFYFDRITLLLDMYGRGNLTKKDFQSRLEDINSQISRHRREIANELAVPILTGTLAGFNAGLGVNVGNPVVSTALGGTAGAALTASTLGIFSAYGAGRHYAPHRWGLQLLKEERGIYKSAFKTIETLTPAEAAKFVRERGVTMSGLQNYVNFLERKKWSLIRQKMAKLRHGRENQ